KGSVLSEPHGRHEQVVRQKISKRLTGHRAGLVGLNAESAQQARLQVLADLVGYCPLMPFRRRLRLEEDLLAAAGPLRSTALGLFRGQAAINFQVIAGEGDGVARRLADTSSRKKIYDATINSCQNILSH